MTTTRAHHEDTSNDPAFAALGDEEFVSLSTFRRSGVRVSSPMWVARDADALVMFTPQASGKVKRLRNDPCVELRPCGRFGRVEDGVSFEETGIEAVWVIGSLVICASVVVHGISAMPLTKLYRRLSRST
jgi:predicted pyridoxine 5'-phosphate oxidase superfamily flavin-nucleotide-binding protein